MIKQAFTDEVNSAPLCVGIAGAGAVGAHYGVRLQQAGVAVRMLARGAHVQAMQAHGLCYESQGVRQILKVCAVDDPHALRDCDVVMLACKTTQLVAMCSALQGIIHPNCALLTMQNGVEAANVVARYFPDHTVIAATAFIGVRLQAPGHVIHSAAGHLWLGLWKGTSRTMLDRLIAAWQNGGVDAREVTDMRNMLWQKMVWNCGFNAITALTRNFAKDVATDEQGCAMVRAAMLETLAVAEAEGVHLDVSVVDQHIALTMQAGEVKTSMWQDLEHHRPSEVAAMNGDVCRLGEKHVIPTPVNTMLSTLMALADISA